MSICRSVNRSKTDRSQEQNASHYLSDFYDRGAKWDRKKNQNLEFAKLHYDAKRRQRLDNCNRVLVFGNNGDEWKLIHGKKCNVRFCDVCEWRRACKMISDFHKIVPRIQELNAKGAWLLLTLTQRNCEIDNLKTTIQAMSKAFNRMRIMQLPGIKGFFRTLEITYNRDTGLHPHYHILLNVNNSYFGGNYYITQAAWCDKWAQAMRLDYSPIIDIRKITNISTENLKGVLEVLKYSVKDADLNALIEDGLFQQFDQQMRGLRKFASGGNIKEQMALIEQEPATDEMAADEQAVQELFSFFNDESKRYLIDKNTN